MRAKSAIDIDSTATSMRVEWHVNQITFIARAITCRFLLLVI